MRRSLVQSLVLLRLPRGGPPPSDAQARHALAADRERLALPPANSDYRVAGPYAIEVDGQAMDEYVVWEI